MLAQESRKGNGPRLGLRRWTCLASCARRPHNALSSHYPSCDAYLRAGRICCTSHRPPGDLAFEMASSGGLHSLATIIKRYVRPDSFVSIPLREVSAYRLEAATSRLEDLANLPPPSLVTGIQSATSTSLNSASTEPTPVPPPHASAAHAAPTIDIPRSVEVYDEIILEGKVKPFVEVTKSFAVQSVVEQVRVITRRGLKAS